MEKRQQSEDKGLRFNEGKLRYDLFPPFAMEELAKVMTYGSNKYAERNWERGQKWTTVIASLKRHLAALEQGEDFDSESTLLHAAHVLANAAFLTEFYKIYPEGDNRQHTFFQQKRVGLDIDDVLADFCQAYVERYPDVPYPSFWNFDQQGEARFAEIAQDREFWLNVPPKIAPEDLPFEPVVYITSRKQPVKWTEEWLARHGFPSVPVVSSQGESKADYAKAFCVDVFVDDNYETYLDMNANGILTYLMDAVHNRKYDVGYRRLYSLKELPFLKVK